MSLSVTCPHCGSRRIGHHATAITFMLVSEWGRDQNDDLEPTAFTGDPRADFDSMETCDDPWSCLDCHREIDDSALVTTDVPELVPLWEATHAEVTADGQAVVTAFRNGVIDPALMDKLAESTGMTSASASEQEDQSAGVATGSLAVGLWRDCEAFYSLRHSLDTRITELIQEAAPLIERIEWDGDHEPDGADSYFYITEARVVLYSGQVVCVPAFEDWEAVIDLQLDHERASGAEQAVIDALELMLDADDPAACIEARQLSVLAMEASVLDTILAATEIYARHNNGGRCLHIAKVQPVAPATEPA